ncbi:MAG: hypothetical protein IJW70_07285 [Clostridia bacterium]|nr:hypothetical protein [Clostridia bacterium]
MAKPDQTIRCPRCNSTLESRRGACPHCGYDGYIPMSEAEIKRTKLILYPVFAIAAAAVILAVWLLGKA